MVNRIIHGANGWKSRLTSAYSDQHGGGGGGVVAVVCLMSSWKEKWVSRPDHLARRERNKS